MSHIAWLPVYFVGAFISIVVINVLRQLVLPRDPRRPPEVFHYVPWIGCAVSYGIDPYKFWDDCREKYGPVFSYPMLGKQMTAALGPLGSNFVLNGKLAHVNAEQAYTNLTTPVFGDQVVYDVPNHVLMEQKKFVKFGLTTDNFRRYVGLIREEVTGYFDREVFKGGKETAPAIDAFATSSEITILTASATLQGPEVRAGMDKSFAQLYHDLDGGFTPINFVFPSLPLPANKRRDIAQRKMREFYLNILKSRRESNQDPPNDMITALQNQEYKSGEPLTDRQIAHMMIALLMAGQHTSAATGSWAILHLAERPDIQEQLYQEQIEHFGDGNGGLNPLNYDELATPLLSAVIKENLRLHPPLHTIMRKVISDCPVPTSLASPSTEPLASSTFKKQNEGLEYVVPKGNFVLAAPGVSSMDSKIWGQDSLEFKPERWLTGSGNVPGEEDEGEEDYGWGKVSKGGKSAYLPFGAGRHRCIGEQFANVQIGSILATMIREYTWTIDQKFPKNDYNTMIVMPLKPRNVTFKRRQNKLDS
ncbi:Lanosterol 14-alpha-demethylase [Microbotryomycetes sp. JL221]|nr:Lanosterol 14-alpha-demethylase [Microbotryomycetes sp. JL221]